MKKFLIVIGLIALRAVPAFGLIFHGVATPPDRANAWVVTTETTAVFHTTDFGLTWNSVNIGTIRSLFDVFFFILQTQVGQAVGQAIFGAQPMAVTPGPGLISAGPNMLPASDL